MRISGQLPLNAFFAFAIASSPFLNPFMIFSARQRSALILTMYSGQDGPKRLSS
jgi:hypothetical protein